MACRLSYTITCGILTTPPGAAAMAQCLPGISFVPSSSLRSFAIESRGLMHTLLDLAWFVVPTQGTRGLVGRRRTRRWAAATTASASALSCEDGRPRRIKFIPAIYSSYLRGFSATFDCFPKKRSSIDADAMWPHALAMRHAVSALIITARKPSR